MFRVLPDRNAIEPLSKRTLGELGFYERRHLQEWLAKRPEAFGEELLVIQKEFSGFDETNERLDLLALDKSGNLVIIENKLDDSGRDTVWQVLKYASYASSLTTEEIVRIYRDYLATEDGEADAEQLILDFLEESDIQEVVLNARASQRLFVVAGSFRKEVTSTVIWLQQFNLQITCFEFSAFQYGEETFLRLDQIIPTVHEREFSIRMAEKAKEEVAVRSGQSKRAELYLRFWRQLIDVSNARSDLFSAISPNRGSWIQTGVGVRGTTLVYLVNKSVARTELYIDRGPGGEAEVQMIFEYLHEQREAIEESFGAPLIWQALPERRASRVKHEIGGVNVYDEESWPALSQKSVEAMHRLAAALEPHLAVIRGRLR